jgi:hypothetical protein
MSRFVAAGCLGALCSLVLALRVFVAIEPVRVRVVTEPVRAEAGLVRLTPADGRLSGLDAAAVVIARVRHAAGTASFSLRIDGVEICAPDATGGRTRRIDCSWTRRDPAATSAEVLVAGPRSPWTLEYLELATHHGSSSGLLSLYVLPAGSGRAVLPRLVWVLVSMAVLTAMFLLPAPAAAGWRRWRNGLPVAIPVAVFAAVLVLPWVSPYRIVLSVGMFVALTVVAIAPRIWRGTRTGAPHAGRLELALAITLAVAVAIVGITRGTRGVSVSDSYAYASQADLWLDGELRVDQSFALEAPWPDAARTFAPLGYRPHPADARLLVPVYPPGLPILLAVAKWAGGQRALFVVVPICAGLLVLATYGIGRRLGGGPAGLAGAWLAATSPVVIGYSLVVMTDVPVAAAWAGAIFFLTGTSTRSAVAAGTLSGLAVLIRPNLVPLAAVLGGYYLVRWWSAFRDAAADAGEQRWAAAGTIAFGAGAAPWVLAVAWLHTHLYGSPFESGYGSVAGLFDLARVPVNLRQYVTWFAELHTLLALAGLVAVFLPLRWLWPRAPDRRLLVVLAVFVAVLWLLYSAWLVFDEWLYTRFLLASWPMIMIGVGVAAAALARLPRASGWAIALVVGMGLANIKANSDAGTLAFGRGEERGAAAARFARRLVPRESVVVTVFHSGTLRYYAGILTLNYSWLDPGSLDGAVRWLRARGLRVFALLDDAELVDFRRRFGATATFAALDGRPLAVLNGGSSTTLFELGGPPPPAVTTAAEEEFSPRTMAEPVPLVRPSFAAAAGAPATRAP